MLQIWQYLNKYMQIADITTQHLMSSSDDWLMRVSFRRISIYVFDFLYFHTRVNFTLNLFNKSSAADLQSAVCDLNPLCSSELTFLIFLPHGQRLNLQTA